MTTYEYIQTEVTPTRFHELVRAGLVPLQTAFHLQVYEWHMDNGRSQQKTAEHFRIPKSSVGYAVRKMKRII